MTKERETERAQKNRSSKCTIVIIYKLAENNKKKTTREYSFSACRLFDVVIVFLAQSETETTKSHDVCNNSMYPNCVRYLWARDDLQWKIVKTQMK